MHTLPQLRLVWDPVNRIEADHKVKLVLGEKKSEKNEKNEKKE